MSVSGDGVDTGDVVGGHRLEERIGDGPTGVVYRASDKEQGQDVALKILHPDVVAEPEYRERIERDIHVAAQIDHPGLIPILDFGDDEARYVATRFVRGRDLGRLLARVGRLDSEQALSILRRVASALDAAHASGLVHGSVKPSNVIIAEATSGQREGHIYVTDLAVARGVSEASRGAGRPVALDYASPEQIEGDPLTRSTDQYALACMAYACLAGRPPFTKERDSAVMMAHLLEAPPSARTFVDDLPEAADSVFERALAKSPGERFPTCSEFVEELGAAAARPSVSTTPPPKPVIDTPAEESAPGSMETEFRFGAGARELSERQGTTEFTPGQPGLAATGGTSSSFTPPPPDVMPPSPAAEAPVPRPKETELAPPAPAEPPSPEPTPVTEPRRSAAVPRVATATPADASPSRREPVEESAESPTVERGPRRRALAIGLGLGAAALVVGGIIVATTRGGSDPRAAIDPAPKADSVGVLAGKHQYAIPLRSLLKNDVGERLKVVGVGGRVGLHGAVRIESGNLVYTPDGGYSGPARFTYTVRNANGHFGVATVTAQVKGLTAAERDLVALVPSGARASCRAGGTWQEVRCDLPVGAIVLRRYKSRDAASRAFAKQFPGAEGDCQSSASTGRWVWAGGSADRGRFGCDTSGEKALFGWIYPSAQASDIVAVVTGRTGGPIKQLSAWFFEQAQLPKPS